MIGFYGNHQDDNICLDVINTLNSNEYELDTDFINQYEEQWHREELSQQEYEELSHADREIYNMDAKTWKKFQEQGKFFQHLMIHHGNSFYLCNKVDKRGRIYSSGYHVNVQGSSFKKAMVNFKHHEIPTGLSSW